LPVRGSVRDENTKRLGHVAHVCVIPPRTRHAIGHDGADLGMAAHAARRRRGPISRGTLIAPCKARPTGTGQPAGRCELTARECGITRCG
jgi:hypothetical protein